MSKKIIAILATITILFVCVFAACEKKESLYSSNDDFDFVTDVNGEKVLGKDGELLVYATDEKGKYVTDEAGEKLTQGQQFEPIKNGDVVEDYGFKIKLPEGWDVDESKVNAFVNKGKNEACEITVVKYFYDDYYKVNKDMFEQLQSKEIDVTWEENIDLGKKYKSACRFTMKNEGNMSILYFFENSGNVYKVLFSGENVDEKAFIVDSVEMCKAMSFKNFTYYNDITAVSENSK
ncbi:MAG: hypothetical protein UGF89_05895 [Acutalibacteraceae bacterium]|nr:hypothetical protein [Acutalibacteraceae bacterium]